MPVEAVLFGLKWIWLATLPHPNKHVQILAENLSHRQKTLYLYTKSWGQVDIFSKPLGLEAFCSPKTT